MKKSLNKKGKVVCQKSFSEVISKIAINLSSRLCRDLGKENYAPGLITEIKEPEITPDGMTRLLFRIGIVYCEIKAFLTQNSCFILTTPHFCLKVLLQKLIRKNNL